MAGDVNGDDLDDVVVGASGTPFGENFGAAYVVFGKRSTTAISVSAIASGQGGGFAINGVASQSRLGTAVGSAGDVNGDGLADVIVQVDGARAGARVVFGRSSSAAVDAEALQGGGFAILSGNELVPAVAGVGDVNGDGFDDLGLGAPDASVAGNVDTGRAYVVFGRSVGAAVELSALQAGQPGGFTMSGVRAGDRAGGSIARAGDLNRDGLADLIVSANRAPSNGNAAVGKAYVVFGKANSSPLQLAAIEEGTGNGFAINGVSTEDSTGFPSAGIGDVNNDGIDDIAVSAFTALSFSGVTSIVYGKNDSGAVSLIDLRSGGRGGFVIHGANEFEISGVALGTGDFDGDGIADLFLGASLGSPGDRGTAGRVYAIFGRYLR